MIDATWYLRSIAINGEIDYVPTDENFTFKFEENAGQYTAIANGVENTFQGDLTFDVANETFEFTDIMITLGDCLLVNCDYEDLYFYDLLTNSSNDLKTFEYYYNEFSNETKRLRLVDVDGNVALFYDYPMPNPSPLLFQTWYLYATEVDLGDTQYYYGENVPQMTISEDLSFSAIDNCWELSGNFEYTDVSYNDFGLRTINYERACVLGGSTGYILELLYQYSDPINCIVYSSNMGFDELYMETAPGFAHIFRNETTLSVPENESQKIVITPNPANDFISISGISDPFHTIRIMSSKGNIVLQYSGESYSKIDVSSLSAGLYFISLSSENATASYKFLKQ